MRITIFNGSHQPRPGNTSAMVEEFLRGAAAAGAAVRHIRLVEKTIGFCRACKSCWFKTPGRCPLPDDMPELVQAYLNSDIVGFATPLYVDNVTGRMKAFFDRLIVVGDPHWDVDSEGNSVHRARFPSPTRLVVLANCGYPEDNNFQPLAVLVRRMARNLHLTLSGEIYRSGGALLTLDDAALKPLQEKYFQLLRTAGTEVATTGSVALETARQLQAPILVGPDAAGMFRKRVNDLCDAMERQASLPG